MPFVERAVPVIADERVDPEFGTGALKVTPGHDPLDFEIGRAHDLPELTVIGPDGRMNEHAGELAGLTQDEAEERVLAWIRERGLLVKREAYRHSIALCERCKSRIEPLISLQWWCAMEELKQPALAALRDGPRPLPPALAAPLRGRLARERARLEHLAPDLVGPPAAGLGVPGRPPDRRGDRARGVRRVRLDRADAHRGRARHLVLVGALAVRDPRLAGGDAGARGAGTRATLNATAREIIRLWENRMIFCGLELIGEIPFCDVIIHSTRARAPTGGGCRRASAPASTRSSWSSGTARTRPATGC